MPARVATGMGSSRMGKSGKYLKMGIEAVFKKPFDEQVTFFRGKLGNLIPTDSWLEVQKSAHDTGFMVAGAAKRDLLADFAGAVDEAISDGTGIEAFRKNFDAIVEKHGWSYRGEYNWRTRTIYRTNMASSYAAGRLVQLKSGTFTHWMYRHSDSVARPRPLHVSWDGLTLPADDDWWQTHYPPNGWGCQCYVIGVTKATAERLGGRLESAPDDGFELDGRPKGIDKGWDYQPGATAVDRVRNALLERASALPKQLAEPFENALNSPPKPPAQDKSTSVEVVRSTDKAHLVRDAEGREAWIQKRWLRADGTVNSATFSRQAAEKATRLADKAAKGAADRAFKNDLHPVMAARESEKAIAVEARWENFASDQSGKRLVWFPKSQVKDGKVPGWLIQAKAKEMRDALTSSSTAFEIDISGFKFIL